MQKIWARRGRTPAVPTDGIVYVKVGRDEKHTKLVPMSRNFVEREMQKMALKMQKEANGKDTPKVEGTGGSGKEPVDASSKRVGDVSGLRDPEPANQNPAPETISPVLQDATSDTK